MYDFFLLLSVLLYFSIFLQLKCIAFCNKEKNNFRRIILVKVAFYKEGICGHPLLKYHNY